MKFAEYLRDLQERLRGVPVVYGIDGLDVDTLDTIASMIENGKQIADIDDALSH